MTLPKTLRATLPSSEFHEGLSKAIYDRRPSEIPSEPPADELPPDWTTQYFTIFGDTARIVRVERELKRLDARYRDELTVTTIKSNGAISVTLRGRKDIVNYARQRVQQVRVGRDEVEPPRRSLIVVPRSVNHLQRGIAPKA